MQGSHRRNPLSADGPTAGLHHQEASPEAFLSKFLLQASQVPLNRLTHEAVENNRVGPAILPDQWNQLMGESEEQIMLRVHLLDQVPDSLFMNRVNPTEKEAYPERIYLFILHETPDLLPGVFDIEWDSHVA